MDLNATLFTINKKFTYTISYKRFDTIRINGSSIGKNPAIQKKIYGSGITTLIISNAEMNDIMEIIKHLEKSGLLNKGVSN